MSREFLPWTLVHRAGDGEHFAWYQRAVLVADLGPDGDVSSLAAYAFDADERALDPIASPRCGTCGEVPDKSSLDIVSADGQRGFLDAFRSEQKPWPKTLTDPSTCWWCNNPLEKLVIEHPPTCERCELHLKRER